VRTGALLMVGDTATGKIRSELPEQEWGYFLPDSRKILNAGADDRMHLWQLGDTLDENKRLAAFAAARERAFLSPDGKLLITIGLRVAGLDVAEGKEVFGWDPVTKEIIQPLKKNTLQPEEIRRAALSPDGKLLALCVEQPVNDAGERSRISLCETKTGKIIWKTQSTESIDCLTFSPDGKTLAMGGSRVVLYDVETGKERRALDAHRGPINVLLFSKDGKRLASGSIDGTAVVWNLE
jgi:WD40 repeat protein